MNKICQDDNDKKINLTIFQNITKALISTLCQTKDDHTLCKMIVYYNIIFFLN